MLTNRNKKAFTLIEILIGILIVSTVMITAFDALSAIGVGKIRLMQKTQTQKQVLYFSEKLFEMIKYGGTIDYEEYFNRSVIGNTTYGSGHYNIVSGFGNFGNTGMVGTTTYGNGFYQCISPNGGTMGTGGCVTGNNTVGGNLNGTQQRYGEYSFQFRDYNSNEDLDGGDQDGDGNIVGDDDDEFLGEGPVVFPIGSDVKELYLINGVKRERTFFRYNVKLDPNRPIGSTCTSTDNGASYTGSGCLGTIEYLKLEGRDWGLDHNLLPIDSTQYDGVIDTWVIAPSFTVGGPERIAGSDNNNYWQPLFPDNIHVTEFKVFPHPNIDTDRAWKVDNPNQNVAEYVRIQLGMMPSWKDRKKIKGNPLEFKMSTTINLTDIFTR